MIVCIEILWGPVPEIKKINDESYLIVNNSYAIKIDPSFKKQDIGGANSGSAKPEKLFNYTQGFDYYIATNCSTQIEGYNEEDVYICWKGTERAKVVIKCHPDSIVKLSNKPNEKPYESVQIQMTHTSLLENPSFNQAANPKRLDWGCRIS